MMSCFVHTNPICSYNLTACSFHSNQVSFFHQYKKIFPLSLYLFGREVKENGVIFSAFLVE